MSTHCLIGIERPDGTVAAIFCHFDGYPERPGVGWTLVRAYDDEAKVRALIALGDLDSLPVAGPRVSDDPLRQEPRVYRDRHAFRRSRDHAAAYLYLWRNGAWEGKSVNGDPVVLPKKATWGC